MSLYIFPHTTTILLKDPSSKYKSQITKRIEDYTFLKAHEYKYVFNIPWLKIKIKEQFPEIINSSDKLIDFIHTYVITSGRAFYTYLEDAYVVDEEMEEIGRWAKK